LISPISPSLDRFRRRVQAALFARLPEHVARLTWSAGQIAGHQRDSLRSLLAYAVARSEFHAGRLAGIEPGSFELSDLPALR
jgi:phenylacetate-CoA ligase